MARIASDTRTITIEFTKDDDLQTITILPYGGYRRNMLVTRAMVTFGGGQYLGTEAMGYVLKDDDTRDNRYNISSGYVSDTVMDAVRAVLREEGVI